MEIVVLVECPYCKRPWPVTVQTTNTSIHFYEKLPEVSAKFGEPDLRLPSEMDPKFKHTKGGISPSKAIFSCCNGGCNRDSIVDVELKAHVTTRKIEADGGAK